MTDTPISSKGDLEAFKESIVWKDIVEELESWKSGFEIEMKTIVDNAESENPSTASVLLHMGDINGRIKAVDYMIQLPDIFIQMIESRTGKSDEQEEL